MKAKNYVHGDMHIACSCNVLFNEASNKVVLIDFDWAGVEDVAVYPAFMNPRLNWPEGAAYGMPIRHEHDVGWIRALY